MNIRFQQRAISEIDHEVDYYETRQRGLGEELDAVLIMIRRFPEAAPQWKHRQDRRVAVLDRFRRPGYWARRR